MHRNAKVAHSHCAGKESTQLGVLVFGMDMFSGLRRVFELLARVHSVKYHTENCCN